MDSAPLFVFESPVCDESTVTVLVPLADWVEDGDPGVVEGADLMGTRQSSMTRRATL